MSQRNRRIHFQSEFFGSFDASWSEKSWIDLCTKQKKRKISFRILFDSGIQSWVFLKKSTLNWNARMITVSSLRTAANGLRILGKNTRLTSRIHRAGSHMPPTYPRHFRRHGVGHRYAIFEHLSKNQNPYPGLRSWDEFNFAGKPAVVGNENIEWTSSAYATNSRQ